MNSAEAYRKASGTDTESAKQNGYDIRRRPDVRAAIDAALKDRNVGARCDREWKLAQLREAIQVVAEDKCPKAQVARGKLVMQMAALQGEIIKHTVVTHVEEETPALKRFRLAVERAEAIAAASVAAKVAPKAIPA